MTVDPIVALQSFGYTEREASFLYLVAVHSGYFLRRQFDYFIDRQKGAIAQSFLEKARVAGHIEIIDYGEARHVYHLFSKPIYRLLGNAESQNRRRKGDGLIRARLIALDYVLENDGDHFLESDDERVHFFADVRRTPPEFFSSRHGKLFPALATFPISVADRTAPGSSLVRFLFADEALLTAEKFYRFLSVAERLLRALGTFELPPLHAQFSTLLLHSYYPRIRRNESRSLGMVRLSGLTATKKVADNRTHNRSRGSDVG